MYQHLVVSVIVGCYQVAAQSSFTNIGQVNVSLPGFTTVFEHGDWTDPQDRYSLLVSTFLVIPFTRDSSYMFLRVGGFLDQLESFEPTLIYDNYTWPREPSQIPYDVFGFEAVAQADGFLPFGKNDGSVFVTDVRDFDNPLTYDIARNVSDTTAVEWFYHRVVWKDVDLDGRVDALTCRARRYGDPSTDEMQMLWFQQPESEALGQPWPAHILMENVCDTFQLVHVFEYPDEDPIYALFTTGYFSGTLAVHWTTDPTGSWSDPAQIATRVIDTGHRFFGIDLGDVNNDGRLDFLVTWNAEFNGTLVAYEIPDDFRTGEYVVHLLADGFDASSGLPGGGTPGSTKHFYPTSDQTDKPLILLSGDDDGATYYLTPNSQDPLDWDYELSVIRDEGEGAVMGQPSVVDIDGDGTKEILIPVYFGNAVQIYTYTP